MKKSWPIIISNNISQLKSSILLEKINYRWRLLIKVNFGIRNLPKTILGDKKKNLFARGSTVILNNLIAFRYPIPKLKEELRNLSWDGSVIVTLTKQHLESIVDRFIHNKISEHDLIEWANMIECREDIEFEDLYKDQIQRFIFNTANPDLDGFEYIRNLHKTKLF